MGDPLIVVRTTSRGGVVDYLPALLSAIEAQGASPGIILTDGPVPRTRPGWEPHCTGRRLGGRLAGWAALQLACARGVDLLLLEDDVMPVPHAAPRMLAFEVPDHLAFVSYFDARDHARAAGLTERRSDDFIYAQAVKLPLRTCLYLVSQDPRELGKGWLEPTHNFDRAIGVLAWRQWPSYGLVLPNLVEHVGDVSVVCPARQWPVRSAWLAPWASTERDDDGS